MPKASPLDDNAGPQSTSPRSTPYPLDILHDALTALGDNRVDDARSILAKGWPFKLPGRQPKAGAPFDVLLAVFVRDNFHCRYCGTKVIFPGTVILLSRILPDEFPRGPNWAWFDTHPAVRLYTATLDHIHPQVRGGTTGMDNLVTACWKCNLMKGSFLLEELDWTILPPSPEPFDGYKGVFRDIVKRDVKQQKTPRVRQWYRTLMKFNSENAP